MARRNLRLVAVLAVVLVALTGFTSRGHRHGGGGGGCSSSKSNHGTTSDSNDHSDDGSNYGSSGDSDYDSGSDANSRPRGGYRTPYRSHTATPTGGSGGSAPTAKVTECLDAGRRLAARGATVEVRSHASATAKYKITLEFLDSSGVPQTTGSARVTVRPGATASVRVPPKDPAATGTVVACELVSVD